MTVTRADICEVCGKKVSRGLFNDGAGVGDRLGVWYGIVAKTEGRMGL